VGEGGKFKSTFLRGDKKVSARPLVSFSGTASLTVLLLGDEGGVIKMNERIVQTNNHLVVAIRMMALSKFDSPANGETERKKKRKKKKKKKEKEKKKSRERKTSDREIGSGAAIRSSASVHTDCSSIHSDINC